MTRRILLGGAISMALPHAAIAVCGCVGNPRFKTTGATLPPPNDPGWAEARRLLSLAPTGPRPYDVAQYLLGLPWANRHDTGPGHTANPLIVDLFRDTHLESQGDTTPWCAAFMNWCFQRAGVDGTDCAWAQSFSDWGDQVWAAGDPNLTNIAQPGDVAVFRLNSDPCQGHVAFVAGFESPRSIQVLGGNQSIKKGGGTFGAIDIKALDIDQKFKLLSIRRQS